MSAYQTRFNYTAGGEFLSGGSNYVGFFSTYSDGSIYTGKTKTDTSTVLERVRNFSADYHITPFFKDLVVYDELQLPYSKQDVQIEMNELVNFTTINTKLSYLHTNLLYVYSKMFFGETDVPYEYDKIACISTTTGQYGWYTTSNYSSFGYSKFSNSTTLSSYSDLDNLKRIVVVPFNDNRGFSIFGITDTHLVALTSSNGLSGLSITLYTDVIDNFSSEKCQNLQDLTFDGQYLYVTDSSINGGGQVFKYDITSYYTNDRAFSFNRFLVKPIGGLGGKSDFNKFKNCTVIGSKSGVILVADSGNNAIKVFDSNFVWLYTIALPRGSYTVLDIKYRPIDSQYYVLTKNESTGQFLLFIYNESFKYVERVIFEDVLNGVIDGSFTRMLLSEQDSNVFYVTTNTTIYKKFFSKPSKTFAIFNRAKFGQNPIKTWNFETIKWSLNNKVWNAGQVSDNLKFGDIGILPTNTEVDSIFALAGSAIFHFNDRTRFNTVLREPKIPYYNLNEVLLEFTENVQALTFNKEIYKMYSNILQLKNTLKGKFNFIYNNYGDLEYQNYIYFLDHEIDLLNVETDFNTRINDNEIIQAGTANKIFTRIYELHEAILKLTEPYVQNFKTVVTNSNILLID